MSRPSTRAPAKTLVFVIEDDATIASSVVGLLNDAGYATRVAPSYEAASRYLSSIVPDCIVLDFALPDGSGAEVLSEITRTRHAPPTILLSAQPRARELASRFGVALVPKPYDAEILLAAVATALENDIRPRYAHSA